MKKSVCSLFVLFVFLSLACLSDAQSPLSPTQEFAATVGNHYWTYPDQVYGTANGTPLKLDVWKRIDQKSPAPTVIYIHGGGWVFGDRTGATPLFFPFLEVGWNVVNVEYRMASTSLAPAAVEDTRCALRWVYRNAKKYNVDTNKIVLTGHSAGGHLSLITGMLPEGTGLDNNCPADPQMGDTPMKVAAIVNWYGISDVNDLIQGPNVKTYALMWMGSQTDATAIAKRVSPLTYVRAGLPPILSIHGDADPVVPYQQSVRLHQALTAAGVPNKLVTIKGGGHGQFTDAQLEEAYQQEFAFLHEHGLIP